MLGRGFIPHEFQKEVQQALAGAYYVAQSPPQGTSTLFSSWVRAPRSVFMLLTVKSYSCQ